LRAASVGGLKERAGVLISGVEVGTVADIKLAPGGTNVILTLRIYRDYEIHKDAIFTVEQSGFLGDQYVAVTPTTNALPVFSNGEQAIAEEPFNLQEAARNAGIVVKTLGETAEKLSAAISDLRKHLLTEANMTNVTTTVANLRVASQEAVHTVSNLNQFVSSNSAPFSQSGSNLVVFSRQMNELAASLQGLVRTNEPGINASVKNVESSTESLKAILDDINRGKGLAGALLRDDHMATNLSQITQNLSLTSSNLNRLGLWGILWSRKPPHTNLTTTTSLPLTAPKHPY
jgi:phospholipid/cholesterol/gamma-HCH transport system substrate-binding protein